MSSCRFLVFLCFFFFFFQAEDGIRDYKVTGVQTCALPISSPRTRRTFRRDGSAALNLAYVACGRYDGFWEMSLSSWDVAAGSLIVREAGGVVSDFLGRSGYLESGDIIAATPEVHPSMLRIVRESYRQE